MLTAACLFLAGGTHAAERIVDLRNMQEISRTALLTHLNKADFVLLGELHDNPQHHTTRTWLLEQLAPTRPAVVAEHLQRGRTAADTGALLPTLESAGFDAKNWRWPLHEPLFRQARHSARAVYGGNIDRPLARAIVKDQERALPADIAAAIKAAPLHADARQKLEQDLLDSHCGQITERLIPGLSLAQRARDAALALTLADVVSQNGPPVILFAGNGHVRRDYGIPILLDQLLPGHNTLVIGFLEQSATPESPDAALRSRYDFAWITEPATRADPCLNFPSR